MLSNTSMRRPSLVSRVTLSLVLVLGVAAGAAGCKSGVGERCQVTADCQDGLVCVKGTDTCAESVTGDIDGGIDAALDASAIDAPATDAPAIDAPATDAATDAAIDAP